MTLLVQFWQQRLLLISLVKRDLKVRYKDSMLGFFWSFGRPLFLMLILAGVFGMIMPAGYTAERAKVVPFALFLLTGLLPWMYLTGTLGEGLQSLMANAALIRKISLNSAVFPAATVMGNLIHLLLAGVVYLAFLFFYGHGLGVGVLFAVPALLAQTLLLLGLSLMVASLNVFYRDVSSVTELVITAWFYLTPILYPADRALHEIAQRYPAYASWFQGLYLLNPMAPIVMAYRRAFLFDGGHLREVGDTALLGWLALSGLVSLGIYFLGAAIYRHYRPFFADEL